VQICAVLDVETMGARRSGHADADHLTADQVETLELASRVGAAPPVDAPPDALYCSAFQQHLEMTATRDGKNLPGRRHSVLAVEECSKLVIHARFAATSACHRKVTLWIASVR